MSNWVIYSQNPSNLTSFRIILNHLIALQPSAIPSARHAMQSLESMGEGVFVFTIENGEIEYYGWTSKWSGIEGTHTWTVTIHDEDHVICVERADDYAHKLTSMYAEIRISQTKPPPPRRFNSSGVFSLPSPLP